MNKRNFVLVLLLICLSVVASACKKTGTAAGSAPRTPFIGGTSGITMNFEKDSPPPEVTDDSSFSFNSIIRLKNDGEYRVPKENVKINLVGFDPDDFGRVFNDLRDQIPEDDLESRKRDAEGNTIEGNPTFATFPKNGNVFVPKQFNGNTELTFRMDLCYNYRTFSNTKLCVLKDMININDGSLCNPTSARTIYSSSAPVQITNFRQSVIGKDKLTFSFDIALIGNVDIFWNKDQNLPTTFDSGCPRDPFTRRQRDNSVELEITEIPGDPVLKKLNCGGLENDFKGIVRLVNNRRTVTCTVDLVSDRIDLEKVVGINLRYNVLDHKETKILVKHLANAP